MANFEDYLKSLIYGVGAFAKEEYGNHASEIIDDGTAFLTKAKKDLQRWTAELAEGKLTIEEFDILIKGKKSLAEMLMLKQAGLSQTQIVLCRQKLIDVIIKATKKFFL